MSVLAVHIIKPNAKNTSKGTSASIYIDTNSRKQSSFVEIKLMLSLSEFMNHGVSSLGSP